MHNKNWDDLRFVQAVVDAGSVNAASQHLGVNHATVLRHIASFEDRFGIKVFDRSAKGYRVLPASKPLIEAIETVAQAVQAVERTISGQSEKPSGDVKLTSTDTFSSTILPGIIRDLQVSSPMIRISLQTTNAHVNLSHLDADITVRPAMALPSDLQGTAAAKLGFAIYGLADQITGLRRDEPTSWLSVGSLLSRSLPAKWIAEQVPNAQICTTADSFVTLRDLAKAGLGVTMLPCCLGDDDPDLARLNNDAPQIEVDIWVATHPDMANVPRIKTVCEALIAGLQQQSDRLYGRFPG